MGLSHLGFCVPASRLDEVVAFYKAALAPLGYRELMRPAPHVVGFGAYYPDFWITGVEGEEDGDDARDENGLKRKPIHVAFDTKNRAIIHDFHAAALAAGGKCNGAPGLRPHYHKYYYGSFVLDPMGNNIETVCMWPAWTHWKYWVGAGVFSKKGKED
ncbi:glyoxalase/bleomycin resistance protein/dioxygenase [Histoplasma capsulatum var. duboisii H88]|uniref:Glyoxalase/bleomycin resistance protein/dioxygenase n=1 Tax=Ajellomyces capsulatus (strain H88) TaxID=544711 RepID=F0UMA3_AJEC8|nr:glyoxalase/bleomycin resistance protein/dioxygenase [Histoplasma capsulatum var. duboisii H88]QSS54238.1 glyoxalase/bleomycin resistance protein/dioxygenase [Histoplasma capsulatum var. duboisii H88]